MFTAVSLIAAVMVAPAASPARAHGAGGAMTPMQGGAAQGMMSQEAPKAGPMAPGHGARHGPMGMMGGGTAARGMMGMMGGGMAGPGMAGHGPGMRVVPMRHLSVDDVRHFLAHRLARHGNERLKLGEVRALDDDTIVADIVTVDGSLVRRLKVDRHDGWIRRMAASEGAASGMAPGAGAMQGMGAGGQAMQGMAATGGMAMPADAPTIPAVTGYSEGQRILFIHTETSDAKIAKILTDMMGGSPVLVVPALAEAPAALTAPVYVFTNGKTGDGPSGPLGGQPDVFPFPPGDAGYRPLRAVNLVTWKDPKAARELKSMAELQAAIDSGAVSVKPAGVVVNMSFLTWPGGKR